MTKREGAGARASAEAKFEPRAGSIVDDKFVVDRVLGEGGMGVVVAATHLGLEQHVAIKFLAQEAMRNKEAVERFQREAKVAAKVKSEHIARVHDVGTVEGGVPYIVMEYLEGRDLGDVIDEDGKLPIAEACEIILQACEALAEVHAAGIVHRDLKPSNLFVTHRSDGSPCVKLLDFGISKFTIHPDDTSVDPALTATATIMGSPSYMSPEQLKSTKEVDARTDVWSLGAVLYEALTGRPAFKAETVPQVCAMIASDDPPPPSSLRSSVPEDLERAILACLDKKPDRRSTLAELARVLVQHAPERARVSLERIEAVAGPGPQRSRASIHKADSTPPPRRSRPESRADAREAREPSESSQLPVLAAAGAERARTQASWGEDRRPRRGGSGPLIVLLVVAAGVFAFGVYSGTIKVSALRGQVASATSAVASAVGSALPVATAPGSHHGDVVPAKPPAPVASASSSAAAEPPPAAPSSPPSAATPSPSAAPSSSEEPDEEDEDEPMPVASAIASAIAPYLAPYAGPAPGLSPSPTPPHASASPSAAKKHPKHRKNWKKHR
jgi:serine/threonine-protein kinase